MADAYRKQLAAHSLSEISFKDRMGILVESVSKFKF